MNDIKKIAIKELTGFFSSITAFLFFGAFLAVTLFIFFWSDPFFARNIADVRPLFEWMPVLMIFLVPALTMRMWSEERRSGTLEFLLTASASNVQLVLGKFAACMGLIAIALALTFPVPFTVSFLGPLDWGPVFGGYVASLFLAAAYTAIGLAISARTDNQIVSLLVSVLVCSLFFIIGAEGTTSLFPGAVAEVMRLIGSGSRFQSITRGVIDFRDLYYYLSVTGIFLLINILELEKLRWAGNLSTPRHKKWITITALFMANLLVGNFWIQQVAMARVDVTEGQIYSISPATRNYLSQLHEPLLIRGYFSKKTHPLLQPLVPKVRDLLKEYALAGNGRVKVEFVDPLEKPEIEKEAVEKYGIKPVVFQTASKYQASLTNSYFDILLKYGDQFQKINWKDLIEMKTRGERSLDVELRNPEYDITGAIKKILYSYQSSGNLFDGIERPVKFVGYVSADKNLPPPIKKLKANLMEVLNDFKKQGGDKFSIEFIDPDADGGATAKKIESTYGYRPMSLGLLDNRTFWFYMTLQAGDQLVQVPFPEDIESIYVFRTVQSALKRFSKGFIKTVGLVAPAGQFGRSDFSALQQRLSEGYSFENVSLDYGIVPTTVDLLMVLEPKGLNEKQLFAIDQFLMKGGTVMLSTAPFDVEMEKGVKCRPIDSGLNAWLTHHGIDIKKTMVLDRKNFPLPIPTRRDIGGLMVDEMQLAQYPYFIDVRSDGMNQDSGITGGIDEVMLDYASPIEVDKAKNSGRRVIEILRSSPQSWTSSAIQIEPQYTQQQPLGFPEGNDKGSKVISVSVEGAFDSYFKDRSSPLVATEDKKKPGSDEKPPTTTGVIGKSPDSARIIIFASNSFLNDKILFLASQALQANYIKPLELVQNVLDWSLQDRELLGLRGRTHFARTLPTTNQAFDMFFEYLNYALAIAGLVVVWVVRNGIRKRSKKRYDQVVSMLSKQSGGNSVAKEEARV